MRVRLTGQGELGFAYKPSQAEQAQLIREGKNTEQAAEHQRYIVTPEGVELPDPVATYALALYSTQIEAVDEVLSSTDTEVEISGDEPYAQCPDCTVGFTAKTLAAAKGKLTRHTNSAHA